MADEIEEKLNPNQLDHTSYPEYRAHCLEIYKLHTEMADKISARRDTANSFFLTVQTGLVGIIGFMMKETQSLFLPLVGASLVLCFVWWRLIKSYRGLNSGKFKVLHRIEKRLPLSPYDAEWEAVGRGKNPSLYLQFTKIEGWIPIVFAVIYGLTILFWLSGPDAIILLPESIDL